MRFSAAHEGKRQQGESVDGFQHSVTFLYGFASHGIVNSLKIRIMHQAQHVAVRMY